MWTALLVLPEKQSSPCRVGATGAACKYVKCFQTATGWREAKLGVKVYFDAGASTGAWESPRARGRGVPRGISPACLTESFLFMIPASPLWIHGAAVQQAKASPRGSAGGGRASLHRPEERTTSSLHLMLFTDGKPGGGRGGDEGITKITKKTLRPS